MKIAVTGALGLVGSGVTAGLHDAGHQVIALDRRPPSEAAEAAAALTAALASATGAAATEAPTTATLLKSIDDLRPADLTSYDETRDALEGVDAVVHLAGINAPIAAPEWQVHDNNVLASYHVLTAAATLGIPRVVQSSSVNAIGLSWSRSPEFDYFPVDLDHRSRNEDGYSLSKLVQELQADSLTRRYEELSVVSLRLHAVLDEAVTAQAYIDRVGISWAVNGLFSYCTTASTVDANVRSCSAQIQGHERLWVVEPETYVETESRELAARHYPGVPVRAGLTGRSAFFDVSRTNEVLGWEASTLAHPPPQLVRL